MEISFQYGPNIDICLSWDFFGGNKVDLDATCVMIDETGHTVDAVYYNKLNSDCNALRHHGDA